MILNYSVSIAGMILGQGAFGRVVKAEAIGIVEHVDVLTVAVKMVKGKDFFILCQVPHNRALASACGALVLLFP